MDNVLLTLNNYKSIYQLLDKTIFNYKYINNIKNLHLRHNNHSNHHKIHMIYIYIYI